MDKSAPSLNDSVFTTPPSRGGVLALGNFDGVHRGHQAVIKTTIDYARRHEMPAKVLTMEPHPRTLFEPEANPFRLTPAESKKRLLLDLGIDEVLTLNFTRELASLSAQAFIEQILVGLCGAQHVIAGSDFVFGRDRLGDVAAMRLWLRARQIEVTEVAPLRDSQGEIISSSRIRAALQEGAFAAAQNLLGRPWSIAGTVIPGAQRGKTLGFPTANIELGDHLRPPYGVYAILARPLGSAQSLPGVANIGTRPTVNGEHPLLEFHLFNFHAALYGQRWEVELLNYLRPEKAFPSLEALQEQIRKDAALAQNFLANATSMG